MAWDVRGDWDLIGCGIYLSLQLWGRNRRVTQVSMYERDLSGTRLTLCLP